MPPYLSRFFRCVKLCWSASLLFQWKQFQHIRALVCFWVENCNLSEIFFCSHCYTVQYTKLSKKIVISRERETSFLLQVIQSTKEFSWLRMCLKIWNNVQWGQTQCYIQWVYIAPLSITLRIKTWVVAYFSTFGGQKK